ncbi:MAG TPA: serine hydrolase domain-containing protein [Gemmatimonadaceae bacterium]|nr:serine hydrolase domain-containing protein [Gemmatimonadaceae bacterium]
MSNLKRISNAWLLTAIVASVGCSGNARPSLAIDATPQTAVADSAYADAIAGASPIASALTRESPAISVAVAANGELVWSAAYGHSNLDSAKEATPSDRFRIYSLSKVITASAMMALAERNLMDLDAAIEQYVPAYPNPGGAITARRLAGHLGGIRHYRDDEALWTRRCGTPEEALPVFKSDPLVHPAGTKYLYSSWGYVLLSRAIESAAKTGFAEAVGRLALQPAGIKHVELEAMSRGGPMMVGMYEPHRDSVQHARTVDNSCKWGAGAFIASAEEIALFGAALLSQKIVNKQSLEAMLTPMRTTAGVSTDYGMGLGVGKDSSGRRRATHSGSAIGGRSALYLLPDDGIVVVLLSNVEGERLTGAAGSIAAKFARR